VKASKELNLDDVRDCNDAIAAANSPAMIAMGSGAIAIHDTAIVEIIRTSATEESTSQILGAVPRDVGVRE
jgi:hypothetical protein